MKIEHIAVWTTQLETLRSFYMKYFNARCNEKYINPQKQFSSYFLSFETGARLELMQKPTVLAVKTGEAEQFTGLTHLAMSVGSKEEVDRLTEAIRAAGFTVTGAPRWTGDGYYESVILDPDNNQIEITI